MGNASWMEAKMQLRYMGFDQAKNIREYSTNPGSKPWALLRPGRKTVGSHESVSHRR